MWLKTRAEFLLVQNKGQCQRSSSVLLLALPQLDSVETLAVGLTVSKKIGNAVQRNYHKRRLRQIIRELVKSQQIKRNYHYVLIARQMIKQVDFTILSKQLGRLFQSV